MQAEAVLRICDECGYKVPPGTPRRKRDDKMLCQSCWDGRTAAKLNLADFERTVPPVSPTIVARQVLVRERTAQLVKRAHDAGDQVSIYHCPFCGSGQVIARSDRTVECEFCQAVFTVQVQPMYSAFPQTINGMPVQEPGMPGMDGQPDVAGDEQLAPEDGVSGAVPPLGADDMAGADAGAPAPDDGQDDGESDDDQEDNDDGGNPFAKKKSALFRTAAGHWLPEDEYIRHIALQGATPEERSLVLANIRAQRAAERR